MLCLQALDRLSHKKCIRSCPACCAQAYIGAEQRVRAGVP